MTSKDRLPSQAGIYSAPAMGEPPGSPGYFGQERAARRTQASPRPSPLGDLPGRPSYFGQAAPRPSPVGEPPGSPGYLGQERPVQRTQTEASRPSPVGEPPGSPGYFGKKRGERHDTVDDSLAQRRSPHRRRDR